MSTPADPRTPAELIAYIKTTYGLSWTEMGQRIGRSDRLLRKIVTGHLSGHQYHQALTEWATTGSIVHPPPRARRKNGELIPVRAKKSAGVASVPPIEPGAHVRLPKRIRPGTRSADLGPVERTDPDTGQVTVERQDFPAANRVSTINIPPTPPKSPERGTARANGIKAVVDELRSITRSQARRDKRVKLRVVVDAGGGRGRVVELGSKSGYHASDVLSDIRDRFDGDPQAWFSSQTPDRYADMDVADAEIVKIELTTFDAARPKSTRIAQDQAGTRRWGRRHFTTGGVT